MFKIATTRKDQKIENVEDRVVCNIHIGIVKQLTHVEQTVKKPIKIFGNGVQKRGKSWRNQS